MHTAINKNLKVTLLLYIFRGSRMLHPILSINDQLCLRRIRLFSPINILVENANCGTLNQRVAFMEKTDKSFRAKICSQKCTVGSDMRLISAINAKNCKIHIEFQDY
uniref:Uncharacterized protein n=1 Tax=Rhizophagus irregularis (strain DAOM 181602 / DAOM 197198 / MUCL 43194) TaxID=747089 RepID=U9UKD5_RHIID